MQRRLIWLVALAFLAGCGSSSAASQAPPKAYRDRQLGFHFSYPANWSIPSNAGHYIALSGVKTYVVDVKTRGNQAGVRITVDHNLLNYSTIPEGKIAPDPNGGPDTFHYHRLTVSGWPAIQIERFNGTKVDSIDTITNTHDYSFDVQIITGSPPFPADISDGYNTIVQTLHLPF